MTPLQSFRSSDPRRQMLVLAIAVTVVFAALLAVYMLVLRTTYGVLFADLRPMDAATIVAELDKRKTPYRLEDGGTTILAPVKSIDATRLAILGQDLPLKGTVGFELFNKSDMGLTEFAQRINFRRALEGELARTIMAMDDVDAARVHLVLAEPTIYSAERKRSKASASVSPRPGRRLTGETVRGIQRLIAASVPDLESDGVVVLDGRGVVVSASLVAMEDQASEVGGLRGAVQDYYAIRVREALRDAFPQRTFDVDVTASTEGELGGAQASAPDAFASWSPEARRFGLQVVIGVAPEPTPQAETEISEIASRAIGLDPSNGDFVAVGPAAQAPAPRSPAAPLVDRAPTPVPRATGLPPWLVAAPLLGLLLLAAYALHRGRRPQVRRLSEGERLAFAERLRLRLDEEVDHVAPGA